MQEKKYKWVRIGESLSDFAFADNDLMTIEVSNRIITLAKYQDNLFACAYLCPHAGGILANGYIDTAGNVVCPVHRYKFNCLNGKNVSGEGYYLKTYPVKINFDGIFVGFEERKFLNFL